jgi:very-short-patch-repair endonuclease
MLCALGHVVSTRRLLAAGVTARRLERWVADGSILRLRPGTYACAHLDDEAVIAATAGTRLDCVSLLARIPEAWTGRAHHGIHVRAPVGRHVGSLPPDAVIHRPRVGEPGIVGALISASRCLDPVDWLACVESLLHLARIDERALEILAAAVRGSARPMLGRLDRDAESGLETHARCRLQDAGFAVETQVRVPGVGRLDLVVEGRVAVETDGRRWHEHRFLEDRTKDLRIEAWGIRVLRIAPVHIFDEWAETLATIERMVRECSPAARPWRIAHG